MSYGKKMLLVLIVAALVLGNTAVALETPTDPLYDVKRQAEAGDAESMFYLGWCYAYGNEVEQDYAKAMEWYLKAADLGISGAMCNVGWLYENGYGVEANAALPGNGM